MFMARLIDCKMKPIDNERTVSRSGSGSDPLTPKYSGENSSDERRFQRRQAEGLGDWGEAPALDLSSRVSTKLDERSPPLSFSRSHYIN